MNIFKLEFLKLRKKTRSWLGPILVFWLIMIAYPLTVEYLQENMIIGFFSVLWIAILISMMLATEDFFIEDFNDGFLEQTVIKKYSQTFIWFHGTLADPRVGGTVQGHAQAHAPASPRTFTSRTKHSARRRD